MMVCVEFSESCTISFYHVCLTLYQLIGLWIPAGQPVIFTGTQKSIVSAFFVMEFVFLTEVQNSLYYSYV